MHRVELKDIHIVIPIAPYFPVPNAPCGVESKLVDRNDYYGGSVFLMHRVELKGNSLDL